MVIYKMFVFGSDQKSSMAARAHNVFWLVEILKIFLLETTKPIKLWLRSILKHFSHRVQCESWPFKDHSCHVCFKLTYWFQRRLLNIFSMLKLSRVMVAILNFRSANNSQVHIFIFFSETTKQIWTKLGRNVHWVVIYKIFVFGADRKSLTDGRTDDGRLPMTKAHMAYGQVS
jgi:hypothetical protein